MKTGIKTVFALASLGLAFYGGMKFNAYLTLPPEDTVMRPCIQDHKAFKMLKENGFKQISKTNTHHNDGHIYTYKNDENNHWVKFVTRNLGDACLITGGLNYLDGDYTIKITSSGYKKVLKHYQPNN